MPRQIKFNCVHCGTKLAVPPQMAGVSDHCPKCGGLITSPTLAEWQASLNAAAAAASTSAPHTPQLSSSAAATATPAPGWSAKELAETFHPPEVTPTPPSLARQPAEPTPVPAPTASEPASDGVTSIRIKSPLTPSATSTSSSPPSSPSSAPTENPVPLPGETILSRMLNHPQTIKKSISSPAWSSDPVSEATDASPPSAPEHSASAPKSSPLFSDPASDSSVEEEPSDTALGMGEALAQSTGQSRSAEHSESSSKPLRSTPFLSIQEVKKSKMRRPSFARRVLMVVLYVLVFDALLVLIFRKQLVEMWHTHVVGVTSPDQAPTTENPAALSPAPSADPASAEPATAAPAPSEKLPPPETGPADFPSPPTTQSGPAPFQPVMPEIKGDLPSVAAATADPNSPSAVPQAIPITEEQLANLPPSSLGMTPPATATAPPPPATFEVAGKPADASPPAMAPASAKPTAPAANDPANAPFAVSDAWVFPQATGTEKFETPAKAAPPGTSPAASVVETPGPDGLPPPPPDMALPNGPLSPSAMEAVLAPPPPALEPVSAPNISTPAASTPASSEKPTSNRIPPEAKSAYDALLAFLEATDWKQRAKYSLRASQLGDAMAAHAKAYGDGPISVRNIDFLERHAKTTSSDPYCMFELQGGDLKDNVLVLVAQPNKGSALIDWESFVEFRHDYLLKFLQTNTAPKQRFRVMLRRKHYFDKDVPDMEKKDSFEVSQPSAKYQGHVFIQKGTTLSSTLATQLGWGLDMPVIIELTWKSHKNHHWVEIVSIPHYGWRNS